MLQDITSLVKRKHKKDAHQSAGYSANNIIKYYRHYRARYGEVELQAYTAPKNKKGNLSSILNYASSYKFIPHLLHSVLTSKLPHSIRRFQYTMSNEETYNRKMRPMGKSMIAVMMPHGPYTFRGEWAPDAHCAMTDAE